jgi:uncharacterized protein YkwD
VEVDVEAVLRSRSRIAIVLLLCVSSLLSGFATDHARAGTREDRLQMLQLTNAAREKKDRDALKLDRALSQYALEHSRAMADDGALFHSEDLSDVLRGVNWSMGGENVGVAHSLPTAHSAFMASKFHRQNILQSRYDHVAIGVFESDGSFWVTVIFYG